MAVTTSTTTTTVNLEEHPQYVILDESKWTLEATSDHKGPSPWSQNPNEGPSVLRSDAPLKPKGVLDAKFQFNDVTPNIGREYPEAQLADILKDDDLIRDLAITISRRGVVFFRSQKLTVEQQKTLASKLSSLTFKPETSGLHIHPSTPGGGFLKPDQSGIDPEVTLISSEKGKKVYNRLLRTGLASRGIHQDFGFETIPSAYSILKIVEPLSTGGDTLWWSGYGLYDKLSVSLRNYLSTLTGTFGGIGAEERKYTLFNGPRGAPENIGDELTAVHPAIRTNPVTHWNSVYTAGSQFKSFNDVTDDESKALRDYIQSVLIGSHDIQVRFRWNENDVAIWDNHSVFHSATNDYFDTGIERTGVRVVSLAERPYFDPKGKSRSEDLADKKENV